MPSSHTRQSTHVRLVIVLRLEGRSPDRREPEICRLSSFRRLTTAGGNVLRFGLFEKSAYLRSDTAQGTV
jgi:hypothetical protein